jgi:hypothetical protein
VGSPWVIPLLRAIDLAPDNVIGGVYGAVVVIVARKQGQAENGLSLCLANQLVEQMSPALAATVFGNVGSLCVMQVGRSDAERLAGELRGEVQPEDLIGLRRYTAVVRMLID